MLDLKIKDFSIEKRLIGCEYLGAGASKEAYYDKENDVVVKVPRGRSIIAESGIGKKIEYADNIDDLDSMLEEISQGWGEECLVWPLGQFVTEVIVWNALKDLEEEGWDISNFAAIKEVYLDRNGVIVIEQEPVMRDVDSTALEVLEEDLCDLFTKLEDDYNIVLRDIRTENAGRTEDGTIKIFDYGISTTTSLDDYGSYSCYNEEDGSYEEESYSYEKTEEQEKEEYEYEAIIIIDKNADTGACRDKYEIELSKNGKVEVEDMGLKKLAYEIKGEKEGYYVLYRFKGADVAALERQFRLDEDIIKFITVRIGE